MSCQAFLFSRLPGETPGVVCMNYGVINICTCIHQGGMVVRCLHKDINPHDKIDPSRGVHVVYTCVLTGGYTDIS